MTNPVIMAAKLKQKRSGLESILTEISELKTRSDELVKAVEEAETEEELNSVEKSVEEIQTEITAKQEEKSALEQEIEALEQALEEINANTPNQTQESEGGQRTMTKNIEVREAINAYVKSKGQERAGFTSVEGGALIPEELLQPQKAAEDVVELSKLVNTVGVNSGAGKYPVIKKSGSKMVSVAELVENPELAKPTITEVPYDIETFRGYIPVSQEVIDDADYDVTGMIAAEIQDQELNTKNAAIAAVLKTATAKSATGFDGLKKVFNVELKRVYNAKAVISASLFNELDTTKDHNGRYLLQDDVTVESGKKLFGREVVVLDDDVIGTSAGDLVGFIGDPKAFATLFDRKRASVKWVDNEVYGQLLAGFVRFDVEKTDEEAGFYVTYTPEPEI